MQYRKSGFLLYHSAKLDARIRIETVTLPDKQSRSSSDGPGKSARIPTFSQETRTKKNIQHDAVFQAKRERLAGARQRGKAAEGAGGGDAAFQPPYGTFLPTTCHIPSVVYSHLTVINVS